MTTISRLSLVCCALALAVAACDSKKDAAPATDKKAQSKADPKADAKGGDAKVAKAGVEPAAGDAPKADAPPAAPKEKIDMKALKLANATGWEGQYNEVLESWTFEKYTPAGDGTNAPNRFYVDFMPDDRPGDVAGYAKKLQEDQNFQDMGYLYTKVDKQEANDGGWIIVGTSKDMNDAEDKGSPSFVMYRSAKNVYCRGGTFVDAKLRDEAVAACQSI